MPLRETTQCCPVCTRRCQEWHRQQNGTPCPVCKKAEPPADPWVRGQWDDPVARIQRCERCGTVYDQDVRAGQNLLALA